MTGSWLLRSRPARNLPVSRSAGAVDRVRRLTVAADLLEPADFPFAFAPLGSQGRPMNGQTQASSPAFGTGALQPCAQAWRQSPPAEFRLQHGDDASARIQGVLYSRGIPEVDRQQTGGRPFQIRDEVLSPWPRLTAACSAAAARKECSSATECWLAAWSAGTPTAPTERRLPGAWRTATLACC